MNTKSHLIVIVCFIGAIAGVAGLGNVWLSHKQAEKNNPALAVDDTIYVTIQGATYGKNCHGKEPGVTIVGKPAPETLDATGKYNILEGNATQRVSALCNGKKKCEFSVTNDTLGFEPAAGCEKMLYTTYRCYNFDSTHEIQESYGATMTIDCIPVAKP